MNAPTHASLTPADLFFQSLSIAQLEAEIVECERAMAANLDKYTRTFARQRPGRRVLAAKAWFNVDVTVTMSPEECARACVCVIGTAWNEKARARIAELKAANDSANMFIWTTPYRFGSR